jgi:CBS domain-containing protein
VMREKKLVGIITREDIIHAVGARYAEKNGGSA